MAEVRSDWAQYLEAVNTLMGDDRKREGWEAARRYRARMGKPFPLGEYPREFTSWARMGVAVKHTRMVRNAGAK